ncbi:hypothetical protein Q4603_20390 [Zobellia galactanivorans]|uniref:hypothetical protein n=1 Tax=Zobellia galactanivorans (strain DSM 12802 / CCUG 47099 / CIP 106680 / NCIMB 13871 / Dsij) TaxID=63186 RepID=UPI0026E26AA1|nr:hypothetical protein [Zobellia galactanivorans]MDO6810991.1 hypothetical protein [Zobellia galactanivorans]
MKTITKVTWTALVKYRIRVLFVITNAGEAGMKFWAHLDNWAKYGIKAVQTVTGGIEHGNNVGKAIEILKEEFMQKEVSKDTQFRNLTPREKEYFLTHPNQDSLGLKKGGIHFIDMIRFFR